MTFICVQQLIGNTKDKIISELDKIQQEVREHVENRQEDLEGVEQNIRRFENVLLLVGDCKKSADGLEKRLSKLEDVSGRLDGVFDSIVQMKEGSVDTDQLVQPSSQDESTDAFADVVRLKSWLEAAEHLDLEIF